jgi:S1-C subfamily serine protease
MIHGQAAFLSAAGDRKNIRIREKFTMRTGLPWAVTASLAWLACSLQAAEPDPTPQRVYQQAEPASVGLLVDGHYGGSGCFVDREGLIISALHILARPGRKVEVVSPTVGRLVAKTVAVDMGHDLVLLRVPARVGGYPTLPLATKMPMAGETVFHFGSPVYRHNIIQRGMIARDGLTYEHQGNFIEVMQIAATVQEGTSGGPWLNRAGQIVGVQSGAVTSKGRTAGLANVAPGLAIAPLLASKKNSETPTLGLFVDELWILQSNELRLYPPGQEGLIIQSLQKGGPAMQAGLKKGEVIVAAGQQKIRYRDQLLRLLKKKKPGQEMELSVVGPQGTGQRKVNIAVGRLEVQWPQAGSP